MTALLQPPTKVQEAVRSLPPILFITHRFPYPPDKGDRIRTFHMLRFLGQRCRLYLATLADEPIAPEHEQAVRAYCADVMICPLGKSRWFHGLAGFLRGKAISTGVFWSHTLACQIQTWQNQQPFQGAIVSASSVAPYLELPAFRDVPSVVDLVDVDSQKWFDYAAVSAYPKRWLYHREGKRLRQYEIEISHRAAVTTLVSRAEVCLFQGFSRAQNIHALPNGVDLQYFAPTDSPIIPGRCVFVGALDYRPNIDAACWFVEQIWPGVRKAFPSASFQIVGRRPVPAVHELRNEPGVEVLANVPDVRPYVAAAQAVVAPLRIARGLQNKVLEAFAMQKAVVASPAALAGFSFPADTPALIASDPTSWVEQLSRVFVDDNLRVGLGAKARLFAETEHDWAACLEPLAGWLGLAPGVTAQQGLP